MKYRIVAIDVDGTLVNKNGLVSDLDKEAVERIARLNVKVVLCTGRVVQSTLPILAQLQIKNSLHVFYDGALIADTKGGWKHYQQPMSADLVRELVSYCRKNNIFIELYTNGEDNSSMRAKGLHTYSITPDYCYSERSSWTDEIHRNLFHLDVSVTNFDEIIGKRDILKAEIIVSNDEEAIQAKMIKDCFGESFRFSLAYSPAFPDIDFVNILHPNASKGAAIKRLISEWGGVPEEVIAIGDGLNDIPLLEASGVPVAMGNACPELKQVSNYITLPVEESGVAKAIRFFFPSFF